jgi:hypothetical protein
MRTIQRTSLLVLVVLFGVVACVVPTVSLVDPSAQATSLAQTVQAMIAATQQASCATAAPTGAPLVVPPSASYTPVSPTSTLIPSQTQTATVTPTLAVITTVTPLLPQIGVSVPTNCREGPGTVYSIVGYLLVGEAVQIYAREPSGTWWYIRNPDQDSEFCWVSGKYATTSGQTAYLPIYTPMPTPTPTVTETAAPGFSASYEGLIACSGEWWAEIGLENTELITLRSAGIVLKDTVADTSVSDLTDGFLDRPDCSTSHSRATLLPGKNVVISSPVLSDDPSGHKLRATITLCSETGQNGTCVTNTITFKP